MTERFDCHHCEDSLFGRKYVLREEQPYCVACFEALFASTCEECGKLIGCDCKAPARWSTRAAAGTRPASSATDASSPSEPRASSRRTARTSACPAMRGSMLCSACSARSPSPPGASRTGSSPGTASASCAPPARSRCRASASRPATSSPTAWAASATCTPRSVPAAPTPSADWAAPSTSPSRSGSGITTASTARSARCRWWGEASSRRGMTSCAPTAGRTSERLPTTLTPPPTQVPARAARRRCLLPPPATGQCCNPVPWPLRDFPLRFSAILTCLSPLIHTLCMGRRKLMGTLGGKGF
uniref:Four and a half LIM domains 2 n=2 Tax=Bos TaxID=9903 RepID=A0AAA9TFS6_BOVIN